MKIVKEIRQSPFKPLKRKIHIGKIAYYTPYFLPVGYCPTMFFIRKLKIRTPEEMVEYLGKYPYIKGEEISFSNFPMVRRSKYFVIKIFGFYLYIERGWPIMLKITNLGWKDKYNMPRFEWNPSVIFYFFKYQIAVLYQPQIEDWDTYWEMYLWWRDYCNRDISLAESSWGWIDEQTQETTWNKNNLK